MLEGFALLVILLICSIAIWLIVLLGNLPGNIARAAGHPQAEAISYLAWIGLLTLGIGWCIALVWAKMKPVATDAALERRISELESRLRQAGEQS
jgi:hypothetical protein